VKHVIIPLPYRDAERTISLIKEKMEEKKELKYETPKVETYTDEELLEKLGAAHTGYYRYDRH